ncbi:HNH endonuclease family protein [Amycolatopsis sp. NPDC023774]|uniref:HNH endonuclease family protein n=1 Tax=Amycolatopsis sp. NPDC023774 TaxID=3155015 RepID=UPI0034068622
MATATAGCAATAAGADLPRTAASAAPVNGPAVQQLAELRVAPRGAMTGYTDKQFPHWISQGHNCDTREVVLQRDGRDVRVDKNCHPVAGTWTSPYDGETWTNSSDVDIDHVVPRAQAWVSGAAAWMLQRRTDFANDLTRPELLAVTDNLNQQKRDLAPDQWKPPLVSYWCTYATDWITVKHFYSLTITTAEKTALTDMLGHCPKAGTR